MDLVAATGETWTLSANTIWTVVATITAFLLLVLMLHRFARESAEELCLTPKPAPWRPTLLQSDRRTAFRRIGNPTRVLVAGIDGNRHVEGRILDRSAKGIRLESRYPARSGTFLLVRPSNAPPDTLWVPIDVRWCRKDSWGGYAIGCKFVDELPTSTVALFG